ncbi:MAG: hypothetical protein FVQ78_00970 [Solirubrobacterales bacterium]|nr:hypothetical protein [Solirubrobacterales bacterium]
MKAGRETRPPRGALIVIAVGLIGCVAAALLSTDKPIGAVELSWESKRPLPDSAPAAIPGGGEMRLSGAGIRVAAPNVSGYRLYRVAAVLTIDAGSAAGRGRIRCPIRVQRRTIVARTPNRRASYPRPSEELIKQEVPPSSIVEFNARGTDLAAVELSDAFHEFTGARGVTVEWAPYRQGVQEWVWGLPPGRPAEPLSLAFASIWRTTGTPGVRIACTVETATGSATTATAGTPGGA